MSVKPEALTPEQLEKLNDIYTDAARDLDDAAADYERRVAHIYNHFYESLIRHDIPSAIQPPSNLLARWTPRASNEGQAK